MGVVFMTPCSQASLITHKSHINILLQKNKLFNLDRLLYTSSRKDSSAIKAAVLFKTE